MTDIVSAIERGQDKTVKSLIRERPELLQQIFSGGESLLHKAVFQDRHEIVQLLLQSGADPDIVTPDGDTPLHLAAREGRSESAKRLVEAGAVIQLLNAKGLSPLFYATAGGREGCKEIANMLVANGATVDLNSAVGRKDVDTVKRLLLSQFEAWKTAPAPNELLWNAVRVQSREITKLLLEHGVDPNAKPLAADSPLFLAVSSSISDIEIVRLLLLYGADVNATDSFGDCLLDLARGVASPDIIALLEKQGATKS